MDPLSITAGVAGLITLVSQSIKLASNYTRDVVGMKEQVSTMLQALQILHTILSQLKHQLESSVNPDNTSLPVNNSILENTIQSCNQRVIALLEKLSRVAGSHNTILKMRWPLNKRDHEETIRDIRLFAQWIQLSMTVDNNGLLNKSLLDIRNLSISQNRSGAVLDQVNDQVDNLAVGQRQRTRQDILEWFSPLQPGEAHSSVASTRLEGTCQQMLNDTSFIAWREGSAPSNVILAHGVPGAGKTVLTSFVIDEIIEASEDDIALAFIYIGQHRKEAEEEQCFLAAIIKQWCAHLTNIPQPLNLLFQKHHGKSTRPSVGELHQVLTEVHRHVPRKFLIVDALDECNSSVRKSVVNIIQLLLRNQDTNANTKVFVSCRSHLIPALEKQLKPVCMDVKAADSDITLYLSNAIAESDASSELSPEFRKELISTILAGAKGMFLLPVLQVRQILSEPTAGDMLDALTNIPTDLHAAFEKTLTRIREQPPSRRRLAIRTLMWLAHAQAPLRIEALTEALAWRADTSTIQKAYCPSQQTVLECCMGLVSVEKDSNVKLIHFTAQEFINGSSLEPPSSSPPDLGSLCTRYLSSDDFSSGPVQNEEALQERIEQHPFLPYACMYWNVSSIKCLATATFVGMVSHCQSMLQCRNYLIGYQAQYWHPTEVRSMGPLHIACEFGLARVVRGLLDGDNDINAATSVYGQCPIHLAAANENSEVLPLLLGAKPDINRCNWYGTALHCAAEAGVVENVETLLDAGMNVDVIDPNSGRTALHCAVDMGRWAVVDILLNCGADINARDALGQTVLHITDHLPSQGPEIIANLGLARRKKLDRQKLGWYLSVVGRDKNWLFYTEGVNLDAQDHEGNTPLHIAGRRRNEETWQLLIALGADTGIQNRDGKTAEELKPTEKSSFIHAEEEK